MELWEIYKWSKRILREYYIKLAGFHALKRKSHKLQLYMLMEFVKRFTNGANE